MKNLAFILLLFIFHLPSCVQESDKSPRVKEEKNKFRIDENGDTVRINYRENGTLLSEVTYRDGLRNGLAINFYENGEIKNEIIYKNNNKEGRATWYYENGVLYRETNYTGDQIDGVQKRYYDNGKLMAEVPYKNGQLQLGTKEYTKEGKLKKLYPEIIILPIDKTGFENTYILQISLSKKQRETQFYRVYDGVDRRLDEPLDSRNDMAEITWRVPKGSFVMEKIRIAAEFQTILSNPYRVEKSYNVSVERR